MAVGEALRAEVAAGRDVVLAVVVDSEGHSPGRAGFVMANSAGDAGHSEKEIRKQIIQTGTVDVMIAISPNFFYIVTLPVTLWFFDKAKISTPLLC